MTSKVLVTGGAGFVGSGLVRRLLEKDRQVIVLDSMLRGSRANLPVDKRIEVVEGDIRSEADVAEAMKLRPSQVVHLAAHHFIPYCNEHPTDTIHVNVYGTQVVLDAVARSGHVDKFVFASTAAVYGPSDSPHIETETMAPIDIYGVSKQQGEELVDFFHSQTGVSAVNARLFNVVGPRETNPHLIPDILEQLPDVERMTLGNLVPKRDYIYVDDIADGLITLLDSNLTSGNFNIGTGDAYSAEEVVNMIGKLLGRNIPIDSVPEKQRAGDRPFLCANNDALVSLGWKCKHDLNSTMGATLADYGLL